MTNNSGTREKAGRTTLGGQATRRLVEEVSACLAVIAADLDRDRILAEYQPWLAWIMQGAERGNLVVAVAAGQPQDAFDFCVDGVEVGRPTLTPSLVTRKLGNLELMLIRDPVTLISDPWALGELHRDCLGLLWLGEASDLAADLAEVFEATPLGIVAAPPFRSTAQSAVADSFLIVPADKILTRLMSQEFADAARLQQTVERLWRMTNSAAREHEKRQFLRHRRVVETSRPIRSNSIELRARLVAAKEAQSRLTRFLRSQSQAFETTASILMREYRNSNDTKSALHSIPALSRAGHGGIPWEDVEWEPIGASGSRGRLLGPGIFNRTWRVRFPARQLDELARRLRANLAEASSRLVSAYPGRFNAELVSLAATLQDSGLDDLTVPIEDDRPLRWTHVVPPGDLLLKSAGNRDRIRQAIDYIRRRDIEAFAIEIEQPGLLSRLVEVKNLLYGLAALGGLLVALLSLQYFRDLLGSVASDDGVDLATFESFATGALAVSIFVALLATAKSMLRAKLSASVLKERENFAERVRASMQQCIADEAELIRMVLSAAGNRASEQLEQLVSTLERQAEKDSERVEQFPPAKTPVGAALPPIPPDLTTNLPLGAASLLESRAAEGKAALRALLKRNGRRL